jgi:Fe2+ transport system protein FeoA
MSLFQDASLIVTPNAVKEGKLYSIKPTDGSGDLSVVRATTKTRVNSLGVIESVPINVAALDYSNGSCPSILVEPQRTNLALRSEEFNDAYWTKIGSTISANAINSPNGTLTADRMVDNISTGGHLVERRGTASGVNTLSIFCKKDNNRYIELCAATELLNSARFIFDFDTKTITSFGAIGTTITYVGSNIRELQDGWFRLSLTFSVGSPPNIYYIFSLSNSPNVGTSNIVSYTGDGTKGVYIWGAQLEAGANATSYIPTVASAVTRNADVISKTGISDLIGQTEGTIFFDLKTIKLKPDFNSIMFSNGTDNFRLGITTDVNFTQLQCIYVSTQSFTTNVLALPISTKIKIAIKYSIGELKFFANGVLISSFSPTNDFSANNLTQFRTGRPAGGREFFGEINSILVWKTKLSDDECINLTTL